MSFEKIESVPIEEQEKVFENLDFTRDFGLVDEKEVKEIEQKHSEYWRIPTVAEINAFKKENGRNFFTSKTYWAKDFFNKSYANDLRVVKIGLFSNAWFYADEETKDPKHLVLIKNDTQIEGTEKEKEKLLKKFPF